MHTDFSEFLPGAARQRVAGGGGGEGEGDQSGGGVLSPTLTSLIKKESVGLIDERGARGVKDRVGMSMFWVGIRLVSASKKPQKRPANHTVNTATRIGM